MNFHTPALLKEVLDLLDPRPGQTAVDGTVGGAGHSVELARRISSGGTLIAIDIDPAAINEAQKKFSELTLGTKVILANRSYVELDRILAEQGIVEVNSIMLDLGVSSYDFDSSGRGFSFQKKDEPLDMRFDVREKFLNQRKEPLTAAYIINNYSEKRLSEIFSNYGEEKFGKRIARAAVNVRRESALKTTSDLFNLIRKALPGEFRHKAADTARRIFQAIRIEVNSELENLREFLPKAFAALKPGGRLVVITFQSLEDRIVKNFFKQKSIGCVCPPEFPECGCGKTAEAEILTKKPVTPGIEEIKANPRSKPAKLRAIIKIKT